MKALIERVTGLYKMLKVKSWEDNRSQQQMPEQMLDPK